MFLWGVLPALNDRRAYDFAAPDFLFGQPEQTEDFQFVFNHESPQTTNKDNTGDDFPFSFNFWVIRKHLKYLIKFSYTKLMTID